MTTVSNGNANQGMFDSDHFSPYRADGKLVGDGTRFFVAEKTNREQYGFVCVVTGATQPIGKAITHELAGR